MGKRRFAQVSTSDDEGEDELLPSYYSSDEERNPKQKKKSVILQEDDEDQESSQSLDEDAKPIGEVVRVSSEGFHYCEFEFDSREFKLEDPVLLVPENKSIKPYVAIIKDIIQIDSKIFVTGQWFYRPEEAEKKGGGNWQSSDTRELFYSFHRDEVPAESVMHKCVVHFIPLNKQLPNRKVHPGFIVRKVYDTMGKKLWKLTDKDYETSKQHEIDLLVQKTQALLGDLPDIETEDAAIDQEDGLKNKKLQRRKNITPLDVSRANELNPRSDRLLKPETPGSCNNNPSEYYFILKKFSALTGETQRDKCLEKLLDGIQFSFNSAENKPINDQGKVRCRDSVNPSGNNNMEAVNGSQEKGGKSFCWSGAAVSAVAALEMASHDAFSLDFQKYNQKMRQLIFNLKTNALLSRRLLNGELTPSKILNMSPNELKVGMTAEETSKDEPIESSRMQMIGARCRICREKKVALIEIIRAGHGDRYLLECMGCGNRWYSSRDEASTLESDEPKPKNEAPQEKDLQNS